MKPEKILFLGLGGAGQRHLRIFRGILPDVACTAHRVMRKTPLLKSDFTVDDSQTVEARYGINAFDDLDAALADGPGLAVVATPSALHMPAMQKAAERGVHLFVEKPASHSLDGFAALRETILANRLCFHVCFQRRFHPFFIRVKRLLDEGRLGRVFSASFNVASYIPAWHPFEDFRNLYACHANLGGGVLLTEIHELDLCAWFFGAPRRIGCVGGNWSEHPMDVEDTAHLTLHYDGFAAGMRLCFMQRRNRRGFFIAGTEGCVEWDKSGNVLTFEDYAGGTVETLSEPELTNDDMFHAQAVHFVENINPDDSAAALDAAWLSQSMVDAAKRSMARDGAPMELESVPWLR